MHAAGIEHADPLPLLAQEESNPVAVTGGGLQSEVRGLLVSQVQRPGEQFGEAEGRVGEGFVPGRARLVQKAGVEFVLGNVNADPSRGTAHLGGFLFSLS